MMRRVFTELVLDEMSRNRDIFVISGDLGYRIWDRVQRECPDRFFNVGAAEQCMLDMAVGLALSGRVPIAYSITPFLLYRGFETIRTYIDHEKINVKLVGSGRGRDYSDDGISHWCEDDVKILSALGNVAVYIPETLEAMRSIFPEFISRKEPAYLNLARIVG